MSSSACATAASSFPSTRRIGGRASRPFLNAAPAAPSGPVTTRSVSGLCSRAAGNPFRTAERGHAQHRELGTARVAADDRDAGLVQPLVELEHVVELRLGGQRQRDHERFGLRPRGSQVAEVDRGGAEAELAPGDELEAEVHALDERVLRDDEPSGQLRGVVLDPLRKPSLLELGEEAELTDLREPH